MILKHFRCYIYSSTQYVHIILLRACQQQSKHSFHGVHCIPNSLTSIRRLLSHITPRQKWLLVYVTTITWIPVHTHLNKHIIDSAACRARGRGWSYHLLRQRSSLMQSRSCDAIPMTSPNSSTDLRSRRCSDVRLLQNLLWIRLLMGW